MWSRSLYVQNTGLILPTEVQRNRMQKYRIFRSLPYQTIPSNSENQWVINQKYDLKQIHNYDLSQRLLETTALRILTQSMIVLLKAISILHTFNYFLKRQMTVRFKAHFLFHNGNGLLEHVSIFLCEFFTDALSRLHRVGWQYDL